MRRPRLLLAVGTLIGLAAAAAIPAIRNPILRSSGRILVANEPAASVDVIIVTPESDAAGLLEAADLVAAGASPRVALFAPRPQPADIELQRRGVVTNDVVVQSQRILAALGVATIERIPAGGAGTGEEAAALAGWCVSRGFRSAVVVSSADHTRRLRRILRRQAGQSLLTFSVRAARFSMFDPDRWWMTRDGVRTEIVEAQKLLLDVLRHPL